MWLRQTVILYVDQRSTDPCNRRIRSESSEICGLCSLCVDRNADVVDYHSDCGQ